MSYRSVNFVSNGFGASNYTPAGPLGNQFITPYGDPYRVDSVGFSLGGVFSAIGNVLGGVGKVIAPVLPGLAQVGVGSLLNKSPQAAAANQQPSQSQFTQVTGQAQVQQAEKSNTAIYVAVGAAALIAAYFLLSKRRR
jgi:hypothetical protein